MLKGKLDIATKDNGNIDYDVVWTISMKMEEIKLKI